MTVPSVSVETGHHPPGVAKIIRDPVVDGGGSLSVATDGGQDGRDGLLGPSSVDLGGGNEVSSPKKTHRNNPWTLFFRLFRSEDPQSDRWSIPSVSRHPGWRYGNGTDKGDGPNGCGFEFRQGYWTYLSVAKTAYGREIRSHRDGHCLRQ